VFHAIPRLGGEEDMTDDDDFDVEIKFNREW
jgi:hypothetical protein